MLFVIYTVHCVSQECLDREYMNCVSKGRLWKDTGIHLTNYATSIEKVR